MAVVFGARPVSDGAAPVQGTLPKLSINRDIFERFLQEMQKSIMAGLLADPPHPIPSIVIPWRFDTDHGKCGVATTEDLLRLQVLATQVEYKSETGSVYHFRIYAMEDLPSLVSLTIRLDKAWMLVEPAEGTAVQVAQLLLDQARARWPANSKSRAIVISATWEKDSYWLIRFRVTEDLAKYIRDTLQGRIQFGITTFTVFYLQKPWKGDREIVTMVSDNAPPDV